MNMPTLKAFAIIATAFCATGALAQQDTSPETAPNVTIVPIEPAAPAPDEGTAPVEIAPAETVPAETVPVETVPVETAPAETAPAETAPVEVAPVEVETAPVEVETAPAETVPAEGATDENNRRIQEEPGPALDDGTDLSTMPADSADINAGNPDPEPVDVTPAEAREAAEIFGELPIIGQPQPGGIGFQPASTSLAAELHWLDAFLLVIITVIAIFVTGLIGWVVVRYNQRSNPTPARFTHNSPLEVTWTIVPILILVAIGAFSLPVLFDQQRIPEGDVVVKVTGYQWFWEYDYPEEEGVTFSSYMIGADTGNMLTEDSLAQLQNAGYTEDQFRLATDTSIVVPVGKTVVMQVTGGDVIHSWTIPAFGVKQDGIPGRLAQLWFRAEAEGIYFGQCSELCGIAHAYMPITVKAVSQEKYDAWLAAVKAGELETW